jgi:hypothetical protein
VYLESEFNSLDFAKEEIKSVITLSGGEGAYL